MKTAARLTCYAGALALVLGTSWGLGSVVGAPAPAVDAPRVAPPAPAVERVWQGEGYQVRLDGDLVPGAQSQIFATVSHDGVAVTDLQPFQDTFGRLVALRTDNLDYLPVHPTTAAGAATRSGPGIAFVADVSAAGTYRLLLDFRHGDTMHTAQFTVATRVPA